MYIEIINNTDGYIGGLATFLTKPTLVNGKIYELNEQDSILLHQALVARDGVELVENGNYDVQIGNIKLKFNDYQNKTIAKAIKRDNKTISSKNKSDELIKYIHNTIK